MARTLTPAFQAELDAGSVAPAVLVSLEFETNAIYLWNGIGDLAFGGETYLGNGWFQGWSAVKEEGDPVPKGITITLTGIPQALVSLVLAQSVQDKFGSLYLGFLNSSNQLILDPYLMYRGNMDVPVIQEDANGPAIQITIENRLLDLDRPRNFRYSNESQRLFFTDDLGFQFVESLQNWEGYWGSKKEDNKKRGRRRRRRNRRRRR